MFILIKVEKKQPELKIAGVDTEAGKSSSQCRQRLFLGKIAFLCNPAGEKIPCSGGWGWGGN